MWNALTGLLGNQQDAGDEDADLQAAIDASMGVTQPQASSTHRSNANSSLDEDALLARAIAESKKEAALPKKDTTLLDLKSLCEAFQLDEQIIAHLVKNYLNFVKECPNNSASLKQIDFQKHVRAFNKLSDAQQDVLKVFVNEELSQMTDSFVNQFNFFLNFSEDPKLAFEQMFLQIAKQNEKALAPPIVKPVSSLPALIPVKIKQETQEEKSAQVIDEDPDFLAAIALSKQTAQDVDVVSVSIKEAKQPQVQKRKALETPVKVEAAPVLPEQGPAPQADLMRLHRVLTLGKKMDDVKGAIDLLTQFSSSFKDQMTVLDAYDKTTNERTLAGLSAFMATFKQDNTLTPIQDAKKQKLETLSVAAVPVAKAPIDPSHAADEKKPVRRSSRKKE